MVGDRATGVDDETNLVVTEEGNVREMERVFGCSHADLTDE